MAKYKSTFEEAAIKVFNSQIIWPYGTHSHRPCCWALAELNCPSLCRHIFRYYFCPEDRPMYWFGNVSTPSKRVAKKRVDHRVFALLLMAEIAKDEK